MVLWGRPSGHRFLAQRDAVNANRFGAPRFTPAWWRQRARTATVLLVIALAGIGTMVGTSLPSSTGDDSASSVPAGLFVDSQSPADVMALGNQLGVTPAIMTVYADGSCFCTYSDPPSTSMTLMLGVGALTPGEATSIGVSLVAAGQSNAIIRIMWEQNQDVGGWFSNWNQLAMSPSQYIATFQDIVTTMRAVPGEKFRFMWNPNGGTGNEASGRTWEDTWPGSSYVNYVGVDQYDYSGYAANIQAVVAFAQSQGLPAAIPEWGLDGSDDPSYINGVASLVGNPSNDIAMQAYFSYDGGSSGINSDITEFPKSEAAFTADFGGLPPTTSTTTTTAPTTPGRPPHVMVVMMENQGYSQIIGNPALPYIDSLASTYGSATRSYSYAHPSLPNYLAIVSGSNQGVTVDEPPSSSGVFRVPTLASQLTAAGYSARAYAENLPSDPTNDSGLYAVRHNPWEYFASADTMPVADSSTLLGDLDGTSAPDFVSYMPNLTDDMHTGQPTDTEASELAGGESFLSNFIPSVQTTPWYAEGGQIVIEWDEALDSDTSGLNGGSGGQVPTIVVSAALKGVQDSAPVDTVGVLHSIEDTYGLAHLGGSAADGTIDSLLQTSIITPPTTVPPTPPKTVSPTPTTTTVTPPTTVIPTPTTTTVTPPTTAPSPQPTVTTVTISTDPDAGGQVLTATVSPAPGGGTVAFSVDGQTLGDAEPVGPDGTAVTSVDLANGPHTVTATYSGTSDFESSTVDTVLSVGLAPTTLTVSTPSLSETGTQYVLTVSLTSTGSPIAGAWISFTALGSPLCQTQTNTDGTATCSVDTDPADGLSLAATGYTATFEGDATHLPASEHSPMFGGNHWRGRDGHSEPTWRQPAGSDSWPSSGDPSSPTRSWQSPASRTQAEASTLPPIAASVIDDPTNAKQSGTGFVVGLFALLGLMLIAAMLDRPRTRRVLSALQKSHQRSSTDDRS